MWSSEECEIEKIKNKKKIDGKWYYEIKWAGYSENQNSWIPRKDIYSEKLLNEFENKWKNKKIKKINHLENKFKTKNLREVSLPDIGFVGLFNNHLHYNKIKNSNKNSENPKSQKQVLVIDQETEKIKKKQKIDKLFSLIRSENCIEINSSFENETNEIDNNKNNNKNVANLEEKKSKESKIKNKFKKDLIFVEDINKNNKLSLPEEKDIILKRKNINKISEDSHKIIFENKIKPNQLNPNNKEYINLEKNQDINKTSLTNINIIVDNKEKESFSKTVDEDENKNDDEYITQNQIMNSDVMIKDYLWIGDVLYFLICDKNDKESSIGFFSQDYCRTHVPHQLCKFYEDLIKIKKK